MLVLTRDVGEAIIITLGDGTNITVTVCKVGTEAAKIGIDAPRSIRVLRGELHTSGKEQPQWKK